MSEFKLTLGNPALAVHVLAVAAIKYEVDRDAEAVAICNSMAAQIEAQVPPPEPAIEDLPTGSIIRAKVTRWSSAAQWPDDTSNVVMRLAADGYWTATDGDPAAPFTVVPNCRGSIDIIEVLHVGVWAGEPS